MLRILMVEDNQDLCEGWQAIFDLLGYDLRVYNRSLPALMDRESIEKCDIIITDYYLPDINGVELIKRMRQMKPDVPAILLTGSKEASVVNAASVLPDCQVLHKPLGIDELERRIEDLCGRRSRPAVVQ